jgi:hypothetical protein
MGSRFFILSRMLISERNLHLQQEANESLFQEVLSEANWIDLGRSPALEGQRFEKEGERVTASNSYKRINLDLDRLPGLLHVQRSRLFY